jgi:hypothetical protein
MNGAEVAHGVVVSIADMYDVIGGVSPRLAADPADAVVALEDRGDALAPRSVRESLKLMAGAASAIDRGVGALFDAADGQGHSHRMLARRIVSQTSGDQHFADFGCGGIRLTVQEPAGALAATNANGPSHVSTAFARSVRPERTRGKVGSPGTARFAMLLARDIPRMAPEQLAAWSIETDRAAGEGLHVSERVLPPPSPAR